MNCHTDSHNRGFGLFPLCLFRAEQNVYTVIVGAREIFRLKRMYLLNTLLHTFSILALLICI